MAAHETRKTASVELTFTVEGNALKKSVESMLLSATVVRPFPAARQEKGKESALKFSREFTMAWMDSFGIIHRDTGNVWFVQEIFVNDGRPYSRGAPETLGRSFPTAVVERFLAPLSSPLAGLLAVAEIEQAVGELEEKLARMPLRSSRQALPQVLCAQASKIVVVS